MKSANRLVVSMVVVAALAVAFWVLALGPKRQEADKLAGQVSQLHASLAESQAKATEAVAARRQFPTDYQQLVVLGKAVPPGDETSSLLVELNEIANRSKVSFDSIQLGTGSGESASAPTATTSPHDIRWRLRGDRARRPRPPPRCCRWARRSAPPGSA